MNDIIEIQGKQYKMEPFTKKAQDAFVAYMRFHELAAIKEMRSEIGDDDYYVLLRKHVSGRDNECRFGSDRFFDFIAHPENMAELLWHVLSTHQDCNRAIIRKWVDTDRKEALAVFAGLYESREV